MEGESGRVGGGRRDEREKGRNKTGANEKSKKKRFRKTKRRIERRVRWVRWVK